MLSKAKVAWQDFDVYAHLDLHLDVDERHFDVYAHLDVELDVDAMYHVYAMYDVFDVSKLLGRTLMYMRTLMCT